MRCPRPLIIQTLIFPKGYFEPWDVFSWLDEYGFRSDRMEETRSSFRARQHDPRDFEPESFRTVAMGKGKSLVKAVFGCPNAALSLRVERRRSVMRKATLRSTPTSRRKRSR